MVKIKVQYQCQVYTLVNNMSEAFNSVIVDARSKPIITMLEDIRLYMTPSQPPTSAQYVPPTQPPISGQSVLGNMPPAVNCTQGSTSTSTPPLTAHPTATPIPPIPPSRGRPNIRPKLQHRRGRVWKP